MCRNIHTLFNFDPPATNDEIYDASLQYVRKISGFQKPSKQNEKVFNKIVKQVSKDTKILIDSLETNTPKLNREEEYKKAHERAVKSLGLSQ